MKKSIVTQITEAPVRGITIKADNTSVIFVVHTTAGKTEFTVLGNSCHLVINDGVLSCLLDQDQPISINE